MIHCGGFICIVGRPLLHKPSTCPQAIENRCPCRGSMRQYYLTAMWLCSRELHPILVFFSIFRARTGGQGARKTVAKIKAKFCLNRQAVQDIINRDKEKHQVTEPKDNKPPEKKPKMVC